MVQNKKKSIMRSNTTTFGTVANVALANVKLKDKPKRKMVRLATSEDIGVIQAKSSLPSEPDAIQEFDNTE